MKFNQIKAAEQFFPLVQFVKFKGALSRGFRSCFGLNYPVISGSELNPLKTLSFNI